MKSWQEDLLDFVPDKAMCENGIFRRIEDIEDAALALGFEYVTYGFRSHTPFSKRKLFR
jgi:hypothetical protein